MLDVLSRSQRGRVCEYRKGEECLRTPAVLKGEGACCVIAGEDGYMPGKYTTGDGYHVNRSALTALTDLVRSQTVAYPMNE
ncbi:MAG: hypothetical protein IK043_02670, partial [Candidatus Methanomethylophilaceae archaeon]|nr:hypothetical protein [Candidatus Methanomethylophilaceae archaeon]